MTRIRNNSLRWSDGYTLIELVTVIVILGIIGAISSYQLVDALDIFTASAEEAELAMETGASLERIARELAHSAPIAPGDEAVFSPARGASANSLIFTRPSADAGRCTACVDHSTTVTFSFDQQNQTLIRASAQSGAVILADNVVSFTVSASDDLKEKRIFTIHLARKASSSQDARRLTLRTSVFPPATRESSWEEAIR
ncbi:MAG: type II secretion system protein [Nitrospinae bacterium]|nr:type II secretion system protein [Nitrospinota bacterium]